MTLFKQILLGALAFTVVILGVVGLNSYVKTNEFIEEQLGANASHTAISLGLVILNEAAKANSHSAQNIDDDLGARFERELADAALAAASGGGNFSKTGEFSEKPAYLEKLVESRAAQPENSNEGNFSKTGEFSEKPAYLEKLVESRAAQQNTAERPENSDPIYQQREDLSALINAQFLESIIAPVFDSGYYSRIAFYDADGKLVYEKRSDGQIYGVNDLFVRVVHIPTPTVAQEVRSWQRIGTVQVQISPAFAYSQMYSLLIDLLLSLSAVFLGSLLVIYFALKAVLAPLNRVREQAEAILEHEFIIQERLPFTHEVRKIVMVMNSMVSKVKTIYEKEAQMLERYNELLYLDEITGLFNRRYFANKYKEFLSSEENSCGYFLILSIKETYNLKKYLGFSRGVKFLSDVAKLLAKVPNVDEKNIFKISENDYALLLFNKTDLVQNLKSLLAAIRELFKHYELDESEFLVRAAFAYFDKCPQNELLAKTDLLLMQAKGNFSLNGSLELADGLIMGKQEFKDFIAKSVADDAFFFAEQNVVDDGALLHKELFLRLKLASGEKKSAAYFMPMVNELNLCEEIDFYVIEKALLSDELSAHLPPKAPIAINISARSIAAKNFLRFEQILSKAKCKNVYFELAMSKELKINELIAFNKLIRAHGYALGLDHFGLSKENLMMLNELNISYVKTPVNMLLDLLEDKNAASAANSLEIILNSKDVKIIAIGIENSHTAEAVKKLGIKAMQGRFVSEIKEA